MSSPQPAQNPSNAPSTERGDVSLAQSSLPAAAPSVVQAEVRAVAIHVEQKTAIIETSGGLVAATSLQVTIQTATVTAVFAASPQAHEAAPAQGGAPVQPGAEHKPTQHQEKAPSTEQPSIRQGTLVNVVERVQTVERSVSGETRSAVVAERVAVLVEARETSRPAPATDVKSGGGTLPSGSVSRSDSAPSKPSPQEAKAEPSTPRSVSGASGGSSHSMDKGREPPRMRVEARSGSEGSRSTPSARVASERKENPGRDTSSVVPFKASRESPTIAASLRIPAMRVDEHRRSLGLPQEPRIPASSSAAISASSSREPLTPTNVLRETPVSPSSRIGTNVPEVRASILERVANLRASVERLSTPALEQRRGSEATTSRAGGGDFRRVIEKPVAEIAKGVPSLASRGESTKPAQSGELPPKGIAIPVAPASPKGSTPQAIPGAPIQSDARQLSTPSAGLPRALDVLTRLINTVTKPEVLHQIHAGIDRLCMALAAVAAVGAIAADRITSHIALSLGEILNGLRNESGQPELADELQDILNQILARLEESETLEEAPNATALESVAHGSVAVADIVGIVLDQATGEALAGVEIDAFGLGKVYTNAVGVFILANIPLGTIYRLVPRLPYWSFDPYDVRGACSTLNLHRFMAVRNKHNPLVS
jgi:hypothetical protein